MQDTCFPEKCKLFNLLGSPAEQCPNYIETSWRNEKGEVILIKDCSPRRILIMLQTISNNSISLQKAVEEGREQSATVNALFTTVLKRIEKRNANKPEQLPEG